MAQQEINLEQTDFAAGYISDINPLQFPPNATVDEANFEIKSDGSRERRQGLGLTSTDGVINTPPSTFYEDTSVTSKVYSTVSPNAADSGANRQTDLITLTDTFLGGQNIRCFNGTDNDFPEIPFAGGSPSGSSPYLVTPQTVYQAYTSVNGSNQYLLSLIYGVNGLGEILSTSGDVIQYDDLDGVTNTILSTTGRLSEIVTFAGRMVYSFNTVDDAYGLGIGISRLPDPQDSAIIQAQSLCQCTKAGLPADPVEPSDGVWIYGGDLGKIQRTVPFRNGFLVFTDENIWYLYGEGAYFDPYDFRFDKISSTKIIGNESIVTYDNNVFVWAENGIYVIFPDENTGLPKLQNISKGKIQKFYEALLPDTKRFARGVYNRVREQIRWLYNTNALELQAGEVQRFPNELILDLNTGAFTLNHFEQNDSTYIVDFIPDRTATENFSGAEVVTEADDIIITEAGEVVVAEFLASFTIDSSFKYVVRDQEVGVNTQARTAAINNTSFTDYIGSEGFPTGVDAKAFIRTGYITLNDTQRKKTPNYVTTTFQKTESGYDVENDELIGASGCLMTAYWDFANDNYPAKVHGPYQVYRLNLVYFPLGSDFEYGQDYVTTKNKIRGRGRSMQLKFESEPAKDCRLYSWGFNGELLTKV